MAMDSHDDDHYELLIDTVNNNNHSTKSGNNSVSQNEKPECSSNVSSQAVETLSGSSRRKCATLSKGITIEEFLEAAANNHQLTAIDKLILKNKAALAEERMKKRAARLKSKDKPSAAQKRGDKITKTKVLSSKVANTKHNKLNNANGKNKNNVPRSKSNSKTKITVTRGAVDKTKKTVKLVSKVEKLETRPVNSEPKSRTEARLSNSDPKNKTETRTFLNGDSKNKSAKKAIIKTKGLKNHEKPTTNRKTLLQSVRKLKNKEPKINCKSFDMKMLKSNVAYRTRSVNSEKLRNGKTRIIRGLPEEPPPRPKKKSSKSKDNASSGNTTPIRNVSKRPIKQEPRDEDVGGAKRQKFSVSDANPAVENNNNEGRTQTASKIKDIGGGVGTETVFKQELLKEEIKIESDSANVVQINVNMNIAPNSPTPEEYTPKFDAVKSENNANVPVDATAPYGLVIKEYRSVSDSKPESEKSLAESTNDEFSLDDDTSESLNLQLDNLDDDIEEVDTDDHSCNSMETESVSSEMNDRNSTLLENSVNHFENDSTRDSIFSALGLQSIEKRSQKPKEKKTKEENYRGTLKMVIKKDKGCRRMEMKKTDQRSCGNAQNENILSFYSKTIQNGNDNAALNCSPSESSDSSGMSSLFVEDDTDKDEANITKSEVPEVSSAKETASISNCDVAAGDIDLDTSKDESLIVPEKSCSFSYHPNRLCYDVCKYCFGKFGTLDIPCHVGQLKNLERQKTILNSEPNLRVDTCLCDACFRFVDRKANRPSNKRKAIRPTSLSQRKIMCAVQNCNQVATKLYGKRKWRSKICRKFANLSFDIRRRGNGVALGLCSQHFNMLDMYTLCGICKKRLNRNDMYSIRTEVNDLNDILVKDGIPIKLVDNMLLCKYCHHCMSLRLNFGDPSLMSKSNKEYYESFRKEVLRCPRTGNNANVNSNVEETKSSENQKTENCDNVVPDRPNNKAEELENDDRNSPETSKAQELANGDRSSPETSTAVKHGGGDDDNATPKNHSVDIKDIAKLFKPLESDHSSEKNSTHIQLKFGNLNIGKLSNLNIGQNSQPLPVPEKKIERPSSGTEQLPLIADFSFDNDDSTRGWERCVSTIQFDKSTKKLWQDLQKPYGNQSSFVRHLIMLEKYWRSGALVLSESADAGAVKYISSVKNRIESLDVFSAPKLPPIPALAPAPKPPSPAPQKTMNRRTPEPGIPTPPPLQPAPRPPPPPPLLKLNCISSPFVVRKSTPVCTVRPSPEFSTKTVRTPLPTPPKLERIPLNAYPVLTSKGVILPQIRSKQPITRTENSGQVRSVPVSTLKKLSSNPSINLEIRSRPQSHFFIKPCTATSTAMKLDRAPTSMIIAKLPKTLTVTQIDEIAPKDKKEIKPPLVAAPFLVGEKPSVSVFREMSK